MQGIVERRATIPVLTNILLEARGDRLHLTATDLDMTIRTSCPAEVRAEGRVTVPSKVFLELVRNLPEEGFSLRVDGEAVALESGRFRSRMPLMDAAEFPTLPEEPEGEPLVLPLPLFKLMLARVAFAITREDPKFQLNGALVKVLPQALEIAATDGHRLAVVRAPRDGGAAPFERQLFPRKLIQELLKFDEERVEITAGGAHLGFRLGHRSLISRIVELRFPQYERVIVRDNPNRARIRREALQAALRRVSLLASERARGIRLAFASEGELVLSSIGADLGSAEEALSVEYDGAPVSMAVNAAYLLDVLGALDCETVEIQLRDEKTQCLVVPVDDDPRLEEYVYVLMPMRV